MGELYPSFLLLLLAGCSVQFTLCKDFDKTAENVTDEHTVSPPMKKRTIPASIPKSLYISFFKGKDEAEIDAARQISKKIIDKLANIAKKNVTDEEKNKSSLEHERSSPLHIQTTQRKG